MKKIALKMFLFISIMLMVLFVWSKLMRPKTTIFDGRNENSEALAKGFSDLPKNSLDYLAVGSSNIFMNIDPNEIWGDYGITGYDYASPVQPIYISYYYIKEALKTQKPKVVLLDALGIGMYEDASESYTHLGLDYMPYSLEKVNAINAIGDSNYDKNSFYFPFLLYHSRWSELTKSDFDQKDKKKEYFLGYTPAMYTKAYDGQLLNSGPPCVISDKVISYVKKIKELCHDNGIQLIIVKTPNSEWTSQMSDEVEKLSQQLELKYIDFNKISNDINLNYSTDFCDGGTHLNTQGAKKISNYIGKFLIDSFGFKDKRQDKIASYFNERKSMLDIFNENYKISIDKNANSYFDMIRQDRFVILIAGRETPQTDEINKWISNKLGININSVNYSMIINHDEISLKQDDTSSILESLIDDKVVGYIEMNTLDGTKTKVESKIQVQYQNYSKNMDVNIVVYDKVEGKVIDSAYLSKDNNIFIIER